MKIITSPDLISVIKNKHLLLDTNVFIDSLLHPHLFVEFLNNLKKQDVTLVTIDLVKIEFLKGAPDLEKYKEKEELINKIIDNIIPITSDIFRNTFELIIKYKIHGKALSETDLILGACLLKYKKNLFLLTKNTTDFPLSIFELSSIINVSYYKGIHSYGIYVAI